MPSWTDSLQEDHRWTGRQLIQVGDATDEELDTGDEATCERVATLGKSRGTAMKRILLEDDASSDDDQDDSACEMAVSSALSLGSQWKTPPDQVRVGKRTLLTAEEMEDSDDDFQEQEEEDGVDVQLGEDTTPFQQLAISVPTGEEEKMEEATNAQHNIATTERHSIGESGMEVDMQSSQDVPETASQIHASSPGTAGQDLAVDSGRVQETLEQDDERSSNEAVAIKRRKKAIKYLEHVCLDLLRQLSKCVKLELKRVRRHVGVDDSGSDDEEEAPQSDCADGGAGGGETDKGTAEEGKAGEISIPLLNRASGDLKYLKYPRKPGQADGSTSLSVARFLRVCTLLHETLVNDITVTKRDIFYKDVDLFGKQSVVDALIDDIVASVGLKRADFNVVASPKGLMAATGLSFCSRGITETLGSTPTLIPPHGRISGIDKERPPRWVLIVEKEATFTTLCASGILADQELGDGILITGKGYPDFATLHFLRLVSDTFPNCPIAVLVDADAHGLDILSVYQYGSKGMRFTAEAEGLALGDRATWIGVKATEWSSLRLDMDKLIPITEKDQRFAQSMLLEEDLPVEWKRQLCHMLHMRRKAEIQNLGNVDDPSRAHDMHIGFELVNDRQTPSEERITSWITNSSPPAAAASLQADPSVAIPESIQPSIDSRLEPRPQLTGLLDYVKTKLGELR